MKNKHKKQVLKKARQARKVLTAMAIAVIGMLVLAYFSSVPVNTSRPLASTGLPASYSREEMQQIWTNNFQNLLEKELFGGTYHLPKIRERFSQQTRLIQERFHTNLAIHLVTTYCPDSRDVMAGCWITNNQPQLDIIAPRLVDTYYEQRTNGDVNWQERMQDDVVVSVMHECDHLAFGLVSGSREHPSSLDELVDEESKAWALTCEDTLRPMIEEYHVPLTQSDLIYYRMWVRAGRDEKSPLWNNFIRSAYQVTRR